MQIPIFSTFKYNFDVQYYEYSNPGISQTNRKIYGTRMTPKKKNSECASFIWSVYKSSIRQAAEEHDFSYSFLQRRISGEVIQFNMNGPLTILLRQKKEP